MTTHVETENGRRATFDHGVIIHYSAREHFLGCDTWDCYCNVSWTDSRECKHWFETTTAGKNVCRLCLKRKPVEQARINRVRRAMRRRARRAR